MFKTNAFDLQAKPATDFVKILARTQIMKAGRNICEQKSKQLSRLRLSLCCDKPHVKNDNCKECSGGVLDSGLKGCGFEPHQRHCVVSVSKTLKGSLTLAMDKCLWF